MKMIKAVLAFLVFCTASSYAENQYPQKITFDKLEYAHAYEGTNASSDVFVVEYLPQGETLEGFNQMVTYSELKMVQAKDLEAYFKTMSKDTKAPFFSKTYYSGKDASRNEYYLIKMGVQGNIAEYMVFRFMVKDDHIAYYLYSDRSYNGLNDDWMGRVKSQGNHWLNNIRDLNI